MDTLEVFGLLVCLLLLGFVFYMIFYFMYTSEAQPKVNFVWLSIPLKPEQRKILLQKFPYYRQLNFRNRRKFEYRLKYFLMNKNFYGGNSLQVTDEMKILVGATAVQVTFGFHAMQLPFFDKIILYPQSYYSRHTNQKHKGEVSSAGVIVYSWSDFLKGYQIPNDGFNVGLHEMAHALKMEDIIPNSEYSFLDEEVMDRWKNIAHVEMSRIRSGESKFLRPYAATNEEEFFAVCVEQFFEQPEEFNRRLPLVYSTLAQLLRQDPLALNQSL